MKKLKNSLNKSMLQIILFLILIASTLFYNINNSKANSANKFISLDTTEAYLRVGPGKQYPVLWIYKRKHLPLKILDTYNDWFKVEDYSGIIGWIKKTLISSSRWAFIKNDLQPLKIKPSLPSRSIMIAEYGVLGKVLICKIDWCKLNIENKSGWINKIHLWGVHPEEKIK